MFLIHIISQIVNLKMVEDVFGPRKHYQCDGETHLYPGMVKHSVSDRVVICLQVLSAEHANG
jgi:hypothetical protein